MDSSLTSAAVCAEEPAPGLSPCEGVGAETVCSAGSAGTSFVGSMTMGAGGAGGGGDALVGAFTAGVFLGLAAGAAASASGAAACKVQ